MGEVQISVLLKGSTSNKRTEMPSLSHFPPISVSFQAEDKKNWRNPACRCCLASGGLGGGFFYFKPHGAVALGRWLLRTPLAVTDPLLCTLLLYQSLGFISFLPWSEWGPRCDGSSIACSSWKTAEENLPPVLSFPLSAGSLFVICACSSVSLYT